MKVSDEELLMFWKSLNQHQVKYLMVGSMAVQLHGFKSRATSIVDIWIEDTIGNRQKLRMALMQSGFGDFGYIENILFIPGATILKIGDGLEINIVTFMKGLELLPFDQCLEMASVAIMEGVNVPFLHINHLIENKKALNRPRDQIDVSVLEEIRENRHKII